MPGNARKKRRELEGSREVGGRRLIMQWVIVKEGERKRSPASLGIDARYKERMGEGGGSAALVGKGGSGTTCSLLGSVVIRLA